MDGSSGRPSQHPAVPMQQAAPGGRGARVGLAIALVVGVGFAAVLGLRVKQAVGKQAAVAAERTAAQERLQKKEPTKTTRPTEAKWVPRVDLTGTLKPW